MIEIDISVNGLQEFKQAVDDLALNQVPFALAKSLTLTAKNRQKAVQDAMGDGRFILRRRSFVVGGVIVKSATKQDLLAQIKDRDDFMVLQETGGEKVPHNGHTYLAVPLSGARPTPDALIKAADRPKALMASGNAFIKASERGVLILWKRVQKKPKRMKRGPGPQRFAGVVRMLLPMYALISAADVKARFGFRETAMDGVEQIFRDNFAREFEEAKRTARLK